MTRIYAFIVLAVMAAFAAMPASLAQSRTDGRLFYEMVVTSAGTRSQGWNGTLYDANGKAIKLAAGETMKTDLGTFRMHACTMPWVPCGMIREGTLPQEAPSMAALTDSVPWDFRLYIVAEGSRSEGLRGELRHGDELVSSVGAKPVETAMGRFVPLGESDLLWEWSGWAPDGWDKP